MLAKVDKIRAYATLKNLFVHYAKNNYICLKIGIL